MPAWSERVGKPWEADRKAGGLSTRLTNLLLYQAGWWACVLGAARGYGARGALVAAILVVAHLILVKPRGDEARLLLLAAVVGGLADSLLVQAGLLTFVEEPLLSGLTAPWMLMLWVQFASLLRFSLAWLQGRYLLATLLGALAGPLAYGAGERLGAVRFTSPAGWSLAAISLIWAVALPLLLAAAARCRSGPVGRYVWDVRDAWAIRSSSGVARE